MCMRRCIDFTEWGYSGQTSGQEHEVVYFNIAEILTARIINCLTSDT